MADARVESAYVHPQHRQLHDQAVVTFEEYHYYALLTPAEEDELSKLDHGTTTLRSIIFPSKSAKGDVVHSTPTPAVENDEKMAVTPPDARNLESGERATVSDEEWQNASRALRTASWSAIFYLITMDILGPFNVP